MLTSFNSMIESSKLVKPLVLELYKPLLFVTVVILFVSA